MEDLKAFVINDKSCNLFVNTNSEEEFINEVIKFKNEYLGLLRSINTLEEAQNFLSDYRIKDLSFNLREKEVALITSIIIDNNVLGNTVFSCIDDAYNYAIDFIKEYGVDIVKWEFMELDFDEEVIRFVKKRIN